MHLIITPRTSLEFVRLWLSRTGPVLPLDIALDIRASDSPDYCEWNVENPWWENTESLSMDEKRWHTLADAVPGSILPEWETQWPEFFALNPSIKRTVKDIDRDSLSWGCSSVLLLIAEMHRWRRFEINMQCSWQGVDVLKTISRT